MWQVSENDFYSHNFMAMEIRLGAFLLDLASHEMNHCDITEMNRSQDYDSVSGINWIARLPVGNFELRIFHNDNSFAKRGNSIGSVHLLDTWFFPIYDGSRSLYRTSSCSDMEFHVIVQRGLKQWKNGLSHLSPKRFGRFSLCCSGLYHLCTSRGYGGNSDRVLGNVQSQNYLVPYSLDHNTCLLDCLSLPSSGVCYFLHPRLLVRQIFFFYGAGMQMNKFDFTV